MRFVNNGSCHVYFEELEMDGNPDRENIPFEFLIPVEPQQDDQARVIYGDDSGIVGTIVSMDKGDLVLRTKKGQMKLNPVKNLCKIN